MLNVLGSSLAGMDIGLLDQDGLVSAPSAGEERQRDSRQVRAQERVSDLTELSFTGTVPVLSASSSVTVASVRAGDGRPGQEGAVLWAGSGLWQDPFADTFEGSARGLGPALTAPFDGTSPPSPLRPALPEEPFGGATAGGQAAVRESAGPAAAESRIWAPSLRADEEQLAFLTLVVGTAAGGNAAPGSGAGTQDTGPAPDAGVPTDEPLAASAAVTSVVRLGGGGGPGVSGQGSDDDRPQYGPYTLRATARGDVSVSLNVTPDDSGPQPRQIWVYTVTNINFYPGYGGDEDTTGVNAFSFFEQPGSLRTLPVISTFGPEGWDFRARPGALATWTTPAMILGSGLMPGESAQFGFTIPAQQVVAGRGEAVGQRYLPPPEDRWTGGIAFGDLSVPGVDPQGVSLPKPTPPCDCKCDPATGLITPPQGAGCDGAPSPNSAGPIRYFDGTVNMSSTDLESHGLGTPWGHTRTWSNRPGYAVNTPNGSGAVVTQQMYLRQASGNDTLVVISSGTTARYFDRVGADYQGRFFGREQLSAAAGEFVLTDSSGRQFRFHDFSASHPAGQRGQLKSVRDPSDPARDGTRVDAYTPEGRPTEVLRSHGSGAAELTESYLYGYVSSGPNAGLLQNITLRRRTGAGPWAVVRQAEYTYYDGAEPHGNARDLKTATIKDGAGAVLDVKYYRYYKPGESGGYPRGLKYAFEPPSYARLRAAVADPLTATDAQVAPFADFHFQYDALQRVTREVVQGLGCSACSGGRGTFSFSYAANPVNPPAGHNTWQVRTTETLPDGNQNLVYTNGYGQVMLKVFHDVSRDLRWATYYQYDGQGRLVLTAHPSAVSGYDETRPDLVDDRAGDYFHLRNDSGLIEVTTYYPNTTATETVPGAVAGYRNEAKLRRGELGADVVQGTTQYFVHSGGGATTHPVATETVYRNADRTGGQTISYAYTWFPGTSQMQSRVTTRPVVSAAQNGPGTPDVETAVYDAHGRVIWRKDGDGFLHYTAYDVATGTATKTITDVNTSRTGDFADLPAGWVTPPGGGLHLVREMEVDVLGRATKRVANRGTPDERVTYSVYNDARYEVRTYVGWQAATNRPTGPTQVRREVRPAPSSGNPLYTETLTMTALPTVGNGRPTGGEEVTGLQTLARAYTNDGGQVVRQDAYFNLGGLTHSAAPYLGTAGAVGPDGSVTGHYWSTHVGYDLRGRRNRVERPTGTIEQTVYDGLGRALSIRVGTTDANVTEVRNYVYDGGNVGDGNLTQGTELPGGVAAPRVTQFSYDWRNRRVAAKSGVQTPEDTTTHRPIAYTEYDNLGLPIAREKYDGDGITLGDVNNDGVPDKPAVNLRRVRSTAEYDDRGRVFRTHTYSVNQTTGVVSANSLRTDTWYDRRDLVVKTSQPGGLVFKTSYDGAGRPVKQFVTDGGGDTTWDHAGNVAGDVVLSQTETRYDAAGNPILVTAKERFHDATGAGELGAPRARVTYAAAYYDAANRKTAEVSVGTNGSLPYSRPGTVPPRSDSVRVISYGYSPASRVERVTDPRGIVSRLEHDNLGRVTRTVEAYTDGVPTPSTNRTTEQTYDGAGRVLIRKIVLPGGVSQTTQYVYGARRVSSSDVDSNEFLAEVRYPDRATGLPSGAEAERFTVNALGQNTTRRDRNGTVHTYSHDVLGRLTADAATTLGAGVNGQVRRIVTAYDGVGRAFRFTSFSATAGGSVVNQVQRAFNGLGQLTAEYQSHGGPVDLGVTPKVEYTYSFNSAGSANHSRLVSMTYPNGRELRFNYAAGLDGRIGRFSSLSDDSGILEVYTYLGLKDVVQRSRPQAGVDLTYVRQTGEAAGDAGDQYTGLDRFGRVVDQRWRGNDGTHTDRFQYGYDRDSNRLYRANLMEATFSELYHANGSAEGFDQFNRLTAFARGTLNTSRDAVTASPGRAQQWQLDALGNWESVVSDGVSQSREHDRQNQVTAAGGNLLPYDGNGNTKADPDGRTFVYDAWNRLAVVRSREGAILVRYAHDAFGRRVSEEMSTRRDLYYSASWQVLEERDAGVARTQYVWSPVYADALVLRDRDADANGSLEERRYVQQDANWNVTAVVNVAGQVVERYAYDPYGTPSFLNPDWTRRTESAFAWNYLHQGGRYDTTSGLYQFRMRDYSPTLGRWMQQDPLGYVDGMNLYEYVRGRPGTLLDPNGTESEGGIGWKPIQGGGGGIDNKKGKAGFGPVSLDWGYEVNVQAKSVEKCCPEGSKLAGKKVRDWVNTYSVSYSIEASLATWGGTAEFANLEASVWLGFKGSLGAAGQAAFSLQSDRCNGVGIEAEVCFSVGLSGSVAVGGEATIDLTSWWSSTIGLTGTATLDLGQGIFCFKVTNGSFRLSKFKFEWGGHVDVTVEGCFGLLGCVSGSFGFDL